MAEEFDEVVASFEYSVYEKDDFAIYKYRCKGTNEVIKILGNGLPKVKNLPYLFVGYWDTKKYDVRQFKATSFEPDKPTQEKEIVAYLASLKCGIGKRRAKLIYQHFHEKTWDILENSPIRISEVKGMRGAVLKRALNAIKENKVSRDIVKLFSTANIAISSKTIQDIINFLGDNALEKIKTNPFVIYPTRGYSFNKADSLRKFLGIPQNDPNRMGAIFIKLLRDTEDRGNVCMESTELLKKAIQFSGCSYDECHHALNLMVQRRKLKLANVQGKYLLYLAKNFYYEENICKQINRLSLSHAKTITDIDNLISSYEKENVILAPEQKEAVKAVFQHPISIITGGPGTGKTTVSKAILDTHKLVFGEDSKPILLAPTGKAARRMSEATNRPASTIHSAIGLRGDDSDVSNEERLEGNLVLIDEASMMDMRIASLLLDHIESGAKVVFIGDVDQLPSVGAGDVLKDLIKSSVIHTTTLTAIFRQAGGNAIIENAHKINAGDIYLKEQKNFQIIEAPDLESTFNAACNMYIRSVKQFGVENVILLNPQRNNTSLSVDRFNKTLQEVLNPLQAHEFSIKAGDVCYHKGDRIMELKNGLEAKNGDVGIIREIVRTEDEDSGEMVYCADIEFNNDQQLHRYTAEDLKHCSLAWCTTVHKSQGSEYKTVIMVISSYHPSMLKRNLVYTGVTRAKENVAIIGDRPALYKAICNNQVEVRLTTLSQRLYVCLSNKDK